MRKFLIFILLTFFISCGSTAVEEIIDLPADSSSTTTTLPTTTTTLPTTTTTLPTTTTTVDSVCFDWTISTLANLVVYQTIIENMANDNTDLADDVISLELYAIFMEGHFEDLIGLQLSQESLTPNWENITAHDYLLQSIDYMVDSALYAIYGIENLDIDYIDLSVDYMYLATDYIGYYSDSWKEC